MKTNLNLKPFRDLAALALIGTTGGIATLAQAQIAVASTFQLGVYADANQNVAGNHVLTYATQQFGTLNPYSHSLSVTDLDSVNPGSLTVNSAASASWLNAGQGTVAWRGMGWVHNTYTSSGSKLNDFVIPGPVWSYTFTATANDVFTMAYSVRGFGNVFGLLGAVIEWSGPEGNLDLKDPYNPAASGVFTRNISAGTNYTVGVSNMGNVFTSPIRRNDFGYMDADFNWQIGAVPEPAAYVAISIGLLALLRRRK